MTAGSGQAEGDAQVQIAPGGAFGRLRVGIDILFWVSLFLLAGHLFLKSYPLTEPGAAASALPIDFSVFWAAARLAATGDVLAAFDPASLLAAAGYDPSLEVGNALWLYPPAFILLILPLGWMSFPWAWTGFTLVSLVAFAIALRRPAALLPGGARLLMVAPAVLINCLSVGQNSALWTAGLVAALWAVRGGNAVLAGLWLALMTIKPQLGILVPVALIASRQWSVIGWAAAQSIALSAVATLYTGPEYWLKLLIAMREFTQHIAEGPFPIQVLITPYGLLRELGLAHGDALIGQGAASLAAVAAVAWVWSRHGVSQDLKCATLCAAILMASPYAMYYETVIWIAVVLFLARAGVAGSWWGRAWLFVLWWGSVPPFPLHPKVSIVGYVALITIATTATCVFLALRQQTADNAPAT